MGTCPSICDIPKADDTSNPHVLILKQDVSQGEQSIHEPAEEKEILHASPVDLEKQRIQNILHKLTTILASKGVTIEQQEMDNKIHPELMRKRKDLHKNFQSEKSTHFEQPPLKFKNGDIYHGKWNEHGEMDGPGVMLTDDGRLLEGLWRSGGFAKGRVYTRSNPGVYEGEIEDGMANGYGTYMYPNGIVYEGTWKDNDKHGTGKLTFPDKSQITGEFENDEITVGKMVWPDNTCYEGQFKNSRLHGNGKMKWMNGNTYEGDFVNTTITGKGKFTMKLKGQSYEGEWMNNIMHGKGVYTWPFDITFDGIYENGAKVFGVYKGKSFKYTGGFANNKPNAKALIEVKDKIIQGYWRHGKFKEVEKENETFANFNPEKEAIGSFVMTHIQESSNLIRCNTYKAKDYEMNSLDLSIQSPMKDLHMANAAPISMSTTQMTMTSSAKPGAQRIAVTSDGL